MNKFQLAWKATIKFVDRNLPHILTGMALVGLGTSVASAIKETPKAQEAVIEAKKEKVKATVSHDEGSEEIEVYDISQTRLTPWEAFKVLAPVYWPCALSTAATGACIVMSNRVSSKRYAALLTALSLNEKHLKEYEQKVRELFGEKKEEQVRREIARDKAIDCPEEYEREYVVGRRYPCCLEDADLYFVGDRTSVGEAFNRWNAKGLEDGEVTLEDLIYELGIPVKDTWLYGNTRWCITSPKDLVKPHITDGSTTTGVPCLMISISRHPDRY